MYAIFQLSGFQYRAEEGAVLQVPLQDGKIGDKLEIPEILLVQKNDQTKIGTPFVEGAKIEAELLSHGKGDKIMIYKYKRRTKYRRTQGHRQDFTEVKIKKIVA
jgi:large subunit ribosomal protein L21